MATYTDINGVKLIGTGDEAGTWGTSTNTNLQIIERAANGFTQITLTGTSSNLGESTGSPSSADSGNFKAIEFVSGTLSALHTISIVPTDHARVYMFLNSTTGGQSVKVQQGSATSTVTMANGDGAIVFCDGNNKVVDLTATFTTEQAAQLSTARNFSITGDITASAVSFDGTGNVALSAAYTAGSIVNADINSSAAIADTKLDTISTSSKVSNSATTATNSNTNSAIVARDGSGNFSAGTITANLTGNASGSSGSCTGNAATATKFASAVNIAGVSFDGSQSISLNNNAITNGAGYITGSSLNASNLDSGTVSDARLPSSISSDITGNAATATTAAALTGDATRSGDFTVDASADIVLDADGNGGTSNFKFKNGSGGGTFNIAFDNSENMVMSGAQSFSLSTGGDINLDSGGGQIYFKDNGTQRGFIDVQNASTLDFHAGTSNTEALKITTSGVNVVQGLRVGDTTAPTDNDIHAVADITAGGDITATGAVDGVNGIEVNGTSVISSSRVLQNVTGLKTINSTSILGSGNIAISDTNTGVGIGQSWSDQTSSRAADGTVYQNTTGSPIQVSISAEAASGGVSNFQVSSDNSTYVTVSSVEDVNNAVSFGGIVPNNHYYKVAVASGSIILTFWSELR
mgnify:CR=1 FL=1